MNSWYINGYSTTPRIFSRHCPCEFSQDLLHCLYNNHWVGMAGVIQLGDAIKFAELARTVWELGWSKQHNASQFITELSLFPYSFIH